MSEKLEQIQNNNKTDMTQEDKDLLLQDLCARLPYDVMINYDGHIYVLNEIDSACKDIDYITVRIQDKNRQQCAESVLIEDIKPYLRPMSSMTEEEKKEYQSLCVIYGDHDADDNVTYYYFDTIESFDWLNAHHFDYRGLIDKGLALSTEEFNPYKD